MKILFLSCHSVLEFDETKLFTELGHEVFSLGSYINPNAPHDNKRPGYEGKYNDYLNGVAIQCSKENLHEELIKWADVVYVMHKPEWIIQNWEKIKHKHVIWRTIGQSTEGIERQMILPRKYGLKIIRYSPKEERIPQFAGQDKIIRFYKGPLEFNSYLGTTPMVITVAQSMKKRGDYCGYDKFMDITQGFPRMIYGPNNEDTGIDGGCLSYDELKDVYRKNRAYFYTGTYPASYTLNFMEAFMTGIPVVAIGSEMAELKIFNMDTYEVKDFIQHGENGFCSDNPDELKGNLDYLLAHQDKAVEIGQRGREKAIELFGKEKIKEEWRQFLCSL